DLVLRLRAVLFGVLPFREAIEVLHDLVVTAHGRAVLEDEDGDLVRARSSHQLLTLLGVGRDLAQADIDAELRQALPDAVGVRTPFGLVELHAGHIPAAATRQTESARARARRAAPRARHARSRSRGTRRVSRPAA